jgi:hypothetical protein
VLFGLVQRSSLEVHDSEVTKNCGLTWPVSHLAVRLESLPKELLRLVQVAAVQVDVAQGRKMLGLAKAGASPLVNSQGVLEVLLCLGEIASFFVDDT